MPAVAAIHETHPFARARRGRGQAAVAVTRAFVLTLSWEEVSAIFYSDLPSTPLSVVLLTDDERTVAAYGFTLPGIGGTTHRVEVRRDGATRTLTGFEPNPHGSCLILTTEQFEHVREYTASGDCVELSIPHAPSGEYGILHLLVRDPDGADGADDVLVMRIRPGGSWE